MCSLKCRSGGEGTHLTSVEKLMPCILFHDRSVKMFKDMNDVWTVNQPPQIYEQKLPEIQETNENSSQSEGDQTKQQDGDHNGARSNSVVSAHVEAEVVLCYETNGLFKPHPHHTRSTHTIPYHKHLVLCILSGKNFWLIQIRTRCCSITVSTLCFTFVVCKIQ